MYETVGRTQIRCYTVSTIKDKEYYLTTIWHKFYRRPVVVARSSSRKEAIEVHKYWVRYSANGPKVAFDVEIEKEVNLC